MPGGGEKKDGIVVCERCRGVFVERINADGSIQALGLLGNECCEGWGFEVV